MIKGGFYSKMELRMQSSLIKGGAYSKKELSMVELYDQGCGIVLEGVEDGRTSLFMCGPYSKKELKI